MTGLPDLWLPAEREYTREPPPALTGQALAEEQAFTDVHGPQPGKPQAYRTTVTVAAIDNYQPEGDES